MAGGGPNAAAGWSLQARRQALEGRGTTAHRVIIGVVSVEEAEGRGLEVARRIDRGEVIEEADYVLSFPSASQLFRELSPARLALL